MKRALVLLFALIVIACHQSPIVPSLRKGFITGTYATWEKGHLFRAWDTLIISHHSTDPYFFNVTRISSFQRIIDPNFYPPAFVNSRWTGHYDPDTHILSNTTGRPELFFVPGEYTVNADGLLYERIE
ncbi:hypothetical protein [Puia dinghuensis]|uniref:hypothetical protein n=1 Tax=Puia dinghuensis TaxID=1792502 RepID=UPI00166F345C|nr:hypothetical protein [Puia dinghuensis]